MKSMIKETDLTELIRTFPGDRTESNWLDALELLRRALSDAVQTDAQLGRYWIDDYPRGASSSVCAQVRGKGPVPGLKSDSWEGVLCWTIGCPGGYASAYVFPFRDGSVLQQRGRLADLGSTAETDEFFSYQFRDGKFVCDGWLYGDGPGEWARVSKPGSFYEQNLTALDKSNTFEVGQTMTLSLRLPDPIPKTRCDGARISLVHVNRKQESTNLVPWTVRPTKPNCQHSISVSERTLAHPDIINVPLDEFSIRGGWKPGRYHLAVRVQNLHDPKDWTWTCEISHPIKITIVDSAQK